MAAAIRRTTGWAALIGLIAIMGLSCASPSAAHPPSGPAETSEVNSFAGTVETLGEQQFPDTFAGAVLSPDGVVTIYATLHDHALTAAVAKINKSSDRVDFVTSRFSFSKLTGLTGDLAKHAGRLQHDGVTLSAWGPDVPFDAVYVTLLRPTRNDLQRLSASGLVPASLIPVTRADYIAAAGAALVATVGPDYKIRPGFGDPIHAS